MTSLLALTGTHVVVSPALPMLPSPGEDARRLVRHGLSDVLEWLGEDVGPVPGALTHAIWMGSFAAVSQQTYNAIEGQLKLGLAGLAGGAW